MRVVNTISELKELNESKTLCLLPLNTTQYSAAKDSRSLQINSVNPYFLAKLRANLIKLNKNELNLVDKDKINNIKVELAVKVDLVKEHTIGKVSEEKIPVSVEPIEVEPINEVPTVLVEVLDPVVVDIKPAIEVKENVVELEQVASITAEEKIIDVELVEVIVEKPKHRRINLQKELDTIVQTDKKPKNELQNFFSAVDSLGVFKQEEVELGLKRERQLTNKASIFFSMQPMILPAILAYSLGLEDTDDLSVSNCVIDADAQNASLFKLIATRNDIVGKDLGAKNIAEYKNKALKAYYNLASCDYGKTSVNDINYARELAKEMRNVYIYAGVINASNLTRIREMSMYANCYVCIEGNSAMKIQAMVNMIKNFKMKMKIIIGMYDIAQCNVINVEVESGCTVASTFTKDSLIQLAYKSGTPLWDVDSYDIKRSFEKLKNNIIGGI